MPTAHTPGNVIALQVEEDDDAPGGQVCPGCQRPERFKTTDESVDAG